MLTYIIRQFLKYLKVNLRLSSRLVPRHREIIVIYKIGVIFYDIFRMKYLIILLSVCLGVNSAPPDPSLDRKLFIAVRDGTKDNYFFFKKYFYALLLNTIYIFRGKIKKCNKCLDFFMPGDIHYCKNLIERGANVNAKEETDQSPIHWAVSGGFLEIMKVLIDAGANVNATDKSKRAPIHLSVMFKGNFYAFLNQQDKFIRILPPTFSRTHRHIAASN